MSIMPFSTSTYSKITCSLLLLIATGCTRREHVRIFASASLTAPFEELAAAFEAKHPDASVELHCAGTPRLVLQLREGAAADVFASADQAQMQRIVDAKQNAAAPIAFAQNSLMIVTARDNPHDIDSLMDLQSEDISVLLCGPAVPAGRYSRKALRKACVEVESRSDEPSVRAVVSKVELGVADAGIVYTTDARRAAAKLHTVTIPTRHNIVASYPIAPLSTGSQSALGQAFVDFVLTQEGQLILESHGFAKP